MPTGMCKILFNVLRPVYASFAAAKSSKIQVNCKMSI
jgi:hypothetical protein